MASILVSSPLPSPVELKLTNGQTLPAVIVAASAITPTTIVLTALLTQLPEVVLETGQRTILNLVPFSEHLPPDTPLLTVQNPNTSASASGTVFEVIGIDRQPVQFLAVEAQNLQV